MRVQIVQVEEVARQVKSLSLAPANGHALPAFAPGSHVKIAVPHLAQKRPSPFSLTGPSGNPNHYQIVVHDKKASSLVTRWLHDHAAPGDFLNISEPRCGLQLVSSAQRHCLVAGGSGITAFLSHLDWLRKEGLDYELHYALGSRAEGIYCAALSAQHGSRFKQYVSAEGVRLRLDELLSRQESGTHVYVCGPRRLIQSVVDAAGPVRFPLGAIHWDSYGWSPRVGGNDNKDNHATRDHSTANGRMPRSRIPSQRAKPEKRAQAPVQVW